MRTKYKPWAKPYIDEHKEVMFNLEELSSFDKPYYLEIGSGKGQFLVDMAKKFPGKFFVGVERNVTCCGFTAKKLVEEEIINAKLMFINAEVLMQEIKDESLEGIFLNFSDPWPKDRHARRRLTSHEFLDRYNQFLTPDGCIEFKTDNQDLFTFSLEEIENSPIWHLDASTRDLHNDEIMNQGNVMTEYEEKFSSKGNPICKLIASR